MEKLETDEGKELTVTISEVPEIHLNARRQVTDRIRELRPAGIGLSIISLAELYEGVLAS